MDKQYFLFLQNENFSSFFSSGHDLLNLLTEVTLPELSFFKHIT